MSLSGNPTPTGSPAETLPPVSGAELRKVTAAASIGTLMEYYDFFIAATAASTVWPLLFFNAVQGVASLALALSIVTFSLAYFARPVGGFIFGHLGDRLGRKPILVWTLLTVSAGSLGIALTPSYAMIGALAIPLLALFRILQGIGFGGEWGGAAAWVGEFSARTGRRGFWTGILQASPGLGIAFAALGFAVGFTVLPSAAFVAWGWRVLFVVGALVAVVGAVIRLRMMESPLFQRVQQQKAVERFPASTVLVGKSGGRVLLLALAFLGVAAVTPLVIVPFGVNFTVASLLSSGTRSVWGLPVPAFALFVVFVGSCFGGTTSFLSSVFSDRFGRKRTLILGAALILALSWPYFLLIRTLNPWLILGASVMLQVAQGVGFGPVAAWFTEYFPTRVRYSGAGLSYQVGGLLTGVATGAILPALIAPYPTTLAWPYVAALMSGISAISIAAAVFTVETRGNALDEEVMPRSPTGLERRQPMPAH
jgi:MFS family permease